MSTHTLTARFNDGGTGTQHFSVGDVITLGYLADQYVRTVPLQESGQQIATVEIRSATPNEPLPTFIVQRMASQVPVAIHCAQSCPRAVMKLLNEIGSIDTELAQSCEASIERVLASRRDKLRESQRPAAMVECEAYLRRLEVYGQDVVATARGVIPAEFWQANHSFWQDSIAVKAALEAMETVRRLRVDQLRAATADIIAGRVDGSLLRYMGKIDDVDDVEEVG